MEFRIQSEVIEIQCERPQQVIDWGVSLVQAPSLWAKTKGEGIKVAILDTGIDYRHPDLSRNFKMGVNLTTNNPDDVMDRQGHGTHCAGIVAGSDNDIGIVGIAPEAELYIMKVLGDNGAGGVKPIIAGIELAISKGVDIISMSLGCSVDPGHGLHEAIKKAHDAGIIIVAASGNESTHCGWPAAYDEVIAVGAVDQALNVANFSNFGQELDVSAPGVDILSTYLNSQYAKLSGTSMATPVVAGVVALLLAASRKEGKDLTPDQVLEIIRQRSVDLGQSGKDEHFGNGLINIYKLLEQN